jgi:hypothetical protein
MAELVTVGGGQYLKRSPLGVIGLALITFGIYWLVWYYKINDEIRTFEQDDTISPTRSLMAVLFGWLIIVPPFIAIYNTAKHIEGMERRAGVTQTIEPVLALLLFVVILIGYPGYAQEHLNRTWESAAAHPSLTRGSSAPPAPPAASN